MPRLYALSFEQVAVAAAQDLFFLPGATGKLILPVRWVINSSDTTLPTSQMLAIRARFLPATVTAGSGGSVNQTPAKTDPGDATCSVTTAGANNTTKATTTGSAIIQYENGVHIYNGDDQSMEALGIEMPIGPSEAWVLELLSTVSGTVHMSGTLWLKERAG